MKVRPSLLIKFKFIEEQACKGNILAKQYLEKLRNEETSIDWAHRVLINSIRQQRMLKMMAIADDRHFSYQNEDDLVDFIASSSVKGAYKNVISAERMFVKSYIHLWQSENDLTVKVMIFL